MNDYLRKGQKKIKLPGTFFFLPESDPATAGYELEKLVNFHHEKAKADPKVTGILGFCWNSPPGIEGIREMPGPREKWGQKGAEIINY